MMSIGVLGFVVWSQVVVALFYREVEVINFAVCWNSLNIMGTFNSENLISYAESAGNLSLLILFSLAETDRYYMYMLALLRPLRSLLFSGELLYLLFFGVFIIYQKI
jgi:hypothetical protein